MICKPCATGADVMSRANEVTSLVPKERQKFVFVASTLHKLCHDCDCQHKLPERGKQWVAE